MLFLVTKATWGGAQKYVFDLATHLPPEFEPIVALGGDGLLKQKLDAKEIPIVRIGGMQRDVSIVKEFAAFVHLIYLFLWKIRPDIVHLNSSKAAALGALAAWLTRVPKRIFTVRGWPFKEGRGPLARSAIRAISLFTAWCSDEVIVVSKEDKALGERMRVNHKKIHYIPLALQTSEMYTGEQAEQIMFRENLEIDAPFVKSIRLVTIAELTANKGLGYAIDMMVELQKRAPYRYTYTIIGEGEDGSSLSNKVQELGLRKIVRFANFFSNKPPENLSSEGSRYLRAFHIFVLPSIKEGMPYVLLEAVAAGLPIIATDVVRAEASNFPSIHFVPPGDAHALADAVEKLVNHLPARDPSVVGSFSVMLEKTVDLYR